MSKALKVITILAVVVFCAATLVSCINFFGDNTPSPEPIVTLTPEPDNPTIAPATQAPELSQEDVIKDYFEKRKLCISFYLPFFRNSENEKCNVDDAIVFIISYYDFYNKYTEYKHEIDDDNFYYEIPGQVIQDLINQTFVNPPHITDSSFYISASDIIRYEYTDGSTNPATGILEVSAISKDSDRYLITFSGNNTSSILTVYQSQNGYILESYLPIT